ncbi:MAG: FtsB family cell division protein [Arachnia sp.]
MGRPRSKPARSGPGRGSPRTRTAARPGERAAREKMTARQVSTEESDAAIEQALPPAPRLLGSRALGVTWRLLILAVVVAAIAITLAQSLRVYFAQRQEIAQFRVEIQASNEEIAGLEDQLARWEDPDFVRAEARSRLGWVMPGEVGYRVIGADGEALGGDSAVLAAEEAPTGLWWERVWGSVVVADQPVPEASAIPTPIPDLTIEPSASPTPSQTP